MSMLGDWKRLAIASVQVDACTEKREKLPKSMGFSLSGYIWEALTDVFPEWNNDHSFRCCSLRWERIPTPKICTIRIRLNIFCTVPRLGDLYCALRTGLKKLDASFFVGPMLYQGQKMGFADEHSEEALYTEEIRQFLPDEGHIESFLLSFDTPLRKGGTALTGMMLDGLLRSRVQGIADGQGLDVHIPETNFLLTDHQLYEQKVWMREKGFVKGSVGTCVVHTHDTHGMSLLQAGTILQIGKSTMAGLGCISVHDIKTERSLR